MPEQTSIPPGALPLFDQLRSLGLPGGDYAVFGSGPLIVRGIIAPTNDLDVLCRGAAWRRARALGPLSHLDEHDVDVVTLLDGAIQLGTRWAIGDFDTDTLIDTAEIICGLPFVRLEHVIAYKRLAGRAKDREHLERLSRADVVA